MKLTGVPMDDSGWEIWLITGSQFFQLLVHYDQQNRSVALSQCYQCVCNIVISKDKSIVEVNVNQKNRF